MEYPSLILLLTGGAHLAVGLFVFGRDPKGPLHRALFVIATLLALWALLGAAIWSNSLGVDAALLGRVAHVVSLYLCAGFVSLGLAFPRGDASPPRVLRSAVWAVTTVVAVPSLATPDLIASAQVAYGRMEATYGPLQFAFLGCVTTWIVWGVAELVQRRRQSRGMRRVQITYVLSGLALTGILNVPSNVIAPLFGIHSLGWMGPTMSLAFTGMVAHAIVHHRLMGIRLVVGRGVANVLVVSMAGVLFLSLLRLMNALLVGTGATQTSIAALTIALVFQPLRSRVQAAVLRYFHRPAYDYQSTVRDAGRALAATLDLDAAVDYLLRTVCAALRVERGLVLLHDRVAQGFRVKAAHSGWAGQDEDVPVLGGLTRASPLAMILESAQEPVVREELAARLPRENGRGIQADMEHFGADVAVPLLSGNVLWAVLLVGPKISGDAFTAQDIDLLATLGAEAASAVVNAQLHLDAMQADRLATLGGLAAGIAHEVKNPLVAVRTFAELLPEKHEDLEFREQFSQVVVGEVDRIDRLIGQLLHYARPHPPRLEPVDLNRTVQETLQLLSYEAARCSVKVKTDLASDLAPAMADASQLRQVVLNIALNAIQAMPGGGVLHITTRPLLGRMAADGPYLLPAEQRIEVVFANTGPRIPEDHLARLFEPFFSTRSEGTGLGLSICKRIVMEHNGEIRATLTDEGLTAFTILLPAALPAEARPARCLFEEEPVGLVKA